MNKGSFSFGYFEVEAYHKHLDYRINVLLPERAAHRIAVREFLAGRYYEPFTHSAFKFVLEHKKQRNVIHAGAFFGDMIHTLSMSANLVFGFEPVLENFVFAKKNAERLNLKNLILFNAGLGDVTSLLPIKTADKSGAFSGGAATFDFKGANDQPNLELAPVFRMDDLPLTDVALIELDVEGFELQALTGGRATIERDHPVIMVEDNKKNCASFLEPLGYQLVFSTQGLYYWGHGEDVALLGKLRELAVKLECEIA